MKNDMYEQFNVKEFNYKFPISFEKENKSYLERYSRDEYYTNVDYNCYEQYCKKKSCII